MLGFVPHPNLRAQTAAFRFDAAKNIHYYRTMTTIHRTRNWIIKVYGFEHGIPHFHLHSPEGRAVIAIADGAVLAGTVPKKTLAEARQWSAGHTVDLLAEWRKLNPQL